MLKVKEECEWFRWEYDRRWDKVEMCCKDYPKHRCIGLNRCKEAKERCLASS